MFIKLQDDIWIVWFTEIERAQSRFNRRHVAKVFWYLNSKRNIPFWFGNFLLTYGNLDICANWGKARKLERVADVVGVGRNTVLRKKSIQFEMKHTKRVWEVHPRFECLCSKLQPIVGTLVNLVFTAFSGLVEPADAKAFPSPPPNPKWPWKRGWLHWQLHRDEDLDWYIGKEGKWAWP